MCAFAYIFYDFRRQEEKLHCLWVYQLQLLFLNFIARCRPFLYRLEYHEEQRDEK